MKKSSASAFLISILFVLSFCFAFSAQKQKPTCNPQDLQALLQINAALAIKNSSADCCDWDYVFCDRHHPFHVSQLNFIDNPNITGQIPDAISGLPYLFLLRFINVPGLTGTIPPAITKLPKLSILFISQTNLSGEIPNFLMQVKKLSYLELSLNALTGSIPPELSELSTLDLTGNKLTGTIPESFVHSKSKIKFLLLGNNLLTGTIPKSLGNLDLQSIDLSQNRFSGDASFLFGKNKTITQTLKLNENNFAFDLSNVEFPPFLNELNLSHNNIFGSLNQQLTELSLFKFDVSYNKLCGQIPQGGGLQNFGVDKFFHNKCLCGPPLPAC